MQNSFINYKSPFLTVTLLPPNMNLIRLEFEKVDNFEGYIFLYH